MTTPTVPKGPTQRINRAIAAAQSMRGDLPPEVLALPGLSSPKVRLLLHNLNAARYMEVGVWQGATLISACYGRPALQQAFAFDDFSQFTDVNPRDIFQRNVTQWLDPTRITFRDQSFFEIPQRELPRDIDVYFYDGLHGYDAQRRAISHAWPSLADGAIVVIDDADFGDTIPGTLQGLAEVGGRVSFQRHLPARYNGDTQLWWNGLYIMAVQKS